MTPPPATASSHGTTLDSVFAQYRNITLQVGLAAGVPVLDTWGLFKGDGGAVDGQMFSDGVHLSAKGNAALYKGVRSAIAQIWPEF